MAQNTNASKFSDNPFMRAVENKKLTIEAIRTKDFSKLKTRNVKFLDMSFLEEDNHKKDEK